MADFLELDVHGSNGRNLTDPEGQSLSASSSGQDSTGEVDSILLPKRRSLEDIYHNLRTRLIVPYMILTLLTAMVGLYVVTRLVTSTIRERFANQLLEASRVSADGIIRLEQEHLEQLRLIANIEGVAEALDQEDSALLESILFPLVINEEIELLTITNMQGAEILSLIRNGQSDEYIRITGSDLSNMPYVMQVVIGDEDEVGDKFAGVVQTGYDAFIVSTAPVRDDDGQTQGVLLVGTKLNNLVATLKSQALSDLVVLDPVGEVWATTLPEPEAGYGVLELPEITIAGLDEGQMREITLFKRQYQAYDSPFMIRKRNVGVLSVVLPSNFIVSTQAVSRNLFSLVFTLGTTSIFILGYFISKSISKPIIRLRDVALSVASGDLDKRTELEEKGEIGQLANVFDLMTERLRARTVEATRLYEETLQRTEELAEANTRLQMAQQQLVQSEKLAAIGELTAGIVHDVKNPLAVIAGLVEDLSEDLEESMAPMGHLELIRESAVRANGIVSDLLKFARQSDSNITLQDLCETVRTVVRLTDYQIRKSKVRLSTTFTAERIYAGYDAGQIEQVLVNLVQNAIQAMPDGGDLEIIVRETVDHVEISVRDSGKGIAPENINRIFDPFFTTKPPGEGTGLGLSVSYGIVKEHRGEINVESQVGKGTMFTIRLPKNLEAKSIPPVSEKDKVGAW